MTTRANGPARRWGGRFGAASIGVALAAVVATVPVSADVEREREGSCTGTSLWELQLEKEHGRIEVDLEIDTRRAGRAWNVRLTHNGTRFVSGRRVTDRTGEIDIDRIRGDRRGTDTVRFRAVDTVNGEICRGSVSI